MKPVAGKNGFTLLEVMVASVIGAFIALVSVGALRAVTAGRVMVGRNIAVSDELRYAVELIRGDLANVYRDRSTDAMKFVGTFAGADESMTTSLTMRIVSTANARRGEPEGDVHEVHYYLMEENDKSVLMRRIYPVVGTEDEEELPGGVLTAVAENIAGFELMYFDGEEWVPEWPAELNRLPEMVEVVIAAIEEKEGRQGNLITRRVLATFPRLPQEGQDPTTSGEGGTDTGRDETGSGRETGRSGGGTDGRNIRRGGGFSGRPGGSDRRSGGFDRGRGGPDRGRGGGFDRGGGGGFDRGRGGGFGRGRGPSRGPGGSGGFVPRRR